VQVFDKPSDDFMKDPGQFLKFEVIKNPQSSNSEDPKYIESGKVLSISVVSFLSKQIVI